MRTSLVLALVLLGGVGCESVSPEKIELWKGTQKGPEKIEAALRNGSVAPNLRALAAAAMVEMGSPERVDEAMNAIPANERWEILKALVPLHSKTVESAPLPKVRDASMATPSSRSRSTP
jgi:hypothetical protein